MLWIVFDGMYEEEAQCINSLSNVTRILEGFKSMGSYMVSKVYQKEVKAKESSLVQEKKRKLEMNTRRIDVVR